MAYNKPVRHSTDELERSLSYLYKGSVRSSRPVLGHIHIAPVQSPTSWALSLFVRSSWLRPPALRSLS